MKHRPSKITDLLALLVFGAFSLCLLLVLLTGAKVYRSLVRSGEESFETRTPLQYVATRVRQARTVTVQDFQGCKALVMPETIDGETYLTRVYCYDGYIRELFSSDTAELSPEDGEKVLAGEVLFVLDCDMLQLWSGEHSLVLQLRTGREVGP